MRKQTEIRGKTSDVAKIDILKGATRTSLELGVAIGREVTSLEESKTDLVGIRVVRRKVKGVKRRDAVKDGRVDELFVDLEESVHEDRSKSIRIDPDLTDFRLFSDLVDEIDQIKGSVGDGKLLQEARSVLLTQILVALCNRRVSRTILNHIASHHIA